MVGLKVHLGPGLDTGLVASYKVRPTISVFDKPKAQLTMNSCKVYKYMNLDFDAASTLTSHRNKYLPSADEVIHFSSLICSTKLVLYSIYLRDVPTQCIH